MYKMNLLIISIPLISSITILLTGRFLGKKGGGIISIGSIVTSMIISLKSLIENIEGKIYSIEIKEWLNIGQIKGKIEIIYDKESVLMMNLISIITTIVIIYSYWYLKEDAHINRFISKLLIFSVTMYILVGSKNILFSFLGWEGVGIISFLLINYWYNSIQNSKSAIKAIIFNKIGDIAFLLGIILIIFNYNTLNYNSINIYCSESSENLMNYIIITFIIAAIAKSAQIFLHCWLGDAMAGPTPVSALLHAATMVTAGIYLLMRMKNILINSGDIIYFIILIIGSLTILFAGISALSQNDIKKIIAYSTCSQIGYMFFALSLYKPYEGSLYHLITHGFFKALLFLCAGYIIHILLLEQDIRKYGILIYKTPLFYMLFLIGSLSIIAFPSFSGYYSKEMIMLHSLNKPFFYFMILFIGAILTALYSFKILKYTFFNLPTYFNHNLSKVHLLNKDYYKYFFSFILLIMGSITFGYILLNIFSSPETVDIYIEHNTNNSIILKISILIIPVIALVIMFLTPKNNIFNPIRKLIPLGSRRFFFDTIYNYLILYPIFSYSYHIFTKFIDRGYLEYLGPISLFRIFFYFPKHLNLNSQNITNLPYLFFYFFLSIIVLIIPIYIIL